MLITQWQKYRMLCNFTWVDYILFLDISINYDFYLIPHMKCTIEMSKVSYIEMYDCQISFKC